MLPVLRPAVTMEHYIIFSLKIAQRSYSTVVAFARSLFHNPNRLPSVLLCVIVTAASMPLLADNALVEKKTNLRKDPSAKHSPIRVLLPDEELTILDSTSSSTYLKVKTDDNKTGWVWRKAVEVLPSSTSGSGPTVPPQPPAAGGAGDTISSDWPKPDPVDEDFIGSEGTCGVTGDGGDTATNARKNRTDPLPEFHDVPWSAVASLPYPPAPPSRANWSQAQLQSIQSLEGVALRTTGFLSHKVNVENSGSGESTNCHFLADDDVDWHIYLQENTSDGIDKAVIVETTPRIRRVHQWDPTVLDKWVNSDKPVRITGFLMLDPEHRNQVGKYRGTVWEIHPITNIEVCNQASCSDSDWVVLDNVNQ